MFSTSTKSVWGTIFQLCVLASLVNAEDFYKLLGISRRATNKEIKKAYRQKSLEFHPDKNKAEGAADKFSQINRAYEALMNEETRSIYDRQGEEGLKQHEQRGAGGGGGGGGFDPFEQFFGFGGGGRQRRQEEQSTPNVDVPLKLTLEEMYSGATFEVSYIRQVLCVKWEMCMKNAPECQGPGIKVRRQQIAPGFVQQVQQRDDKCIARGKMWHPNCSECKSQTESEKIDLTVDAFKGIRDGEAITFDSTADEKPGFKAGDLNFIVVQLDHETYHREGDNLYMTESIPLVDALTGFSFTLKKLDGEDFNVTIDDIVECDDILRIPGKGMPRRSGRGYGDLFLTFEVDFPDKMSPDQKKKLREILSGEENGGSNDSGEL
mmetsp:Transcript_16255/g.33409  ORF Transcript_16255/g.33409 Transcript_16255/m.33409 type:complete len:378 (+) Transcript_16255:122-1255(+)|eukprot:CAMPEP_0201115928 /NCGR_PEP_ID=MMETSP0850-20130426/331_1 /ASSEMBLY_ACC=CAM_ASM_000622 /TAXON_ID=183588 /ORGANISM="Pseudo-nitzschia fraudulenta, Strain WWA7" /LENGTH=377 /DNA_ID=CAMNT_0047379855 /DNA_START=73 /DNA_END=1206 /DNA_ORIENTATION=+